MSFLQGLGNIGNAFGSAQDYAQKRQQMQLQQLEMQARQQAMADAFRQQQAEAAAGQAFMQQPGGIPQNVPMPGVTPMPGGGGPQPSPAMGRFGPLPQQPQPAAAGPGPMAGGGAMPPGGAPGASPAMPQDPSQAVQAIARRIAQANPGLPPQALYEATAKTIDLMRGVEPDYKTQMQAEIQIARIQSQSDMAIMKAQSAAEVAQIRADTAQQIAQLRSQTAERGQDLAHGDRQAAEQGKKDRAAGAQAAKGPEAEYKVAATQLREANTKIADLIKENDGMVPAPGSPNYQQYAKLKAQRDGLYDRMVAARKKNPSLPSPKDAVNSSGQSDQPAGDAIPSDLPDPSGMADGTQASDGTDTYVVQGGKWVKQ